MATVQAPVEAGELTVADYLGAWLEHAKARVRATTWEGYEALVRCHAIPHLGHIGLSALHPLHIQGAYAEILQSGDAGGRAISAKTVANLHRVLRSAFGRAVRWKLLEWNPALGVEPPRARRPELAVATRTLLPGSFRLAPARA